MSGEQRVGELEYIGSKTREILSKGDQGDKSPSDVPNDEWNEDGDIIVQCVNDKGKIVHEPLALDGAVVRKISKRLFFSRY